jgi:very-short-patch-repair endonuclease
VIAGFIVDFYCHAAELVIEVDGGIHEALAASDAERDAVLEGMGLRVLHLKNDEIERELDGVARRIAEACGHGGADET